MIPRHVASHWRAIVARSGGLDAGHQPLEAPRGRLSTACQIALAKTRWLRRWMWARRATAALFLLLLISAHFEWLGWLKGSTASTRVLGWFWLADPMAALEVVLASRTLHQELALAALLLVVFYALLGRVFCGWVCPLGLVLDLNDDARDRLNRWLVKRGRRLPEVHIARRVKYVFLALVLILSLASSLPVFQLISPINILSRAMIFGVGWEWLLVLVIVALDYSSRRVWCRAICPLGAFYSLIGMFGRIRVLIDQEKEQGQRGCGLCAMRCPMGIRVQSDYVRMDKRSVDEIECTRCGACVDPCPRSSLRLGIKLSR